VFRERGMTLVELREEGLSESGLPQGPLKPMNESSRAEEAAPNCLDFSLTSLETFRPVAERVPDPQVAEVQRREFFHQLHRWLRQDLQIHVFCNNTGEQQRFLEIWEEYGLGGMTSAAEGAAPAAEAAGAF
jgi:hypothetical protein